MNNYSKSARRFLRHNTTVSISETSDKAVVRHRVSVGRKSNNPLTRAICRAKALVYGMDCLLWNEDYLKS